MTIVEQIQELRSMTVNQLRERYEDAFGESTSARNKDWLWKRIAWKIQELEYGGISERAKKRAKEIANEHDIRVRPPMGAFKEYDDTKKSKPRTIINLPAPGTVLTREYKGVPIEVEVLEEGFLYATQVYKSLSAIAKEVTGSHWNGPVFFGIKR